MPEGALGNSLARFHGAERESVPKLSIVRGGISLVLHIVGRAQARFWKLVDYLSSLLTDGIQKPFLLLDKHPALNQDRVLKHVLSLQPIGKLS